MSRLVGPAACLLALGCSGSRFVVRPPPPGEPVERPVRCTAGRGPAVFDTALAVALAGATVFAVTRPTESSDCSKDFLGLCAASNVFNGGLRVVAVGTLSVTAVVAGVSASKGYRSAARCGALQAADRRCEAGEAAGCGLLGVPLPGSERLPFPPPPPAPPTDAPAAASR